MKKILFSDNSLRDLINFRGDIIDSYAQDLRLYSQAFQHPLHSNWNAPFRYESFLGVEVPENAVWYLSERAFGLCFPLYYQAEHFYGSIAARLCHIPSTAMIACLGYVFNNNSVLGNRIACSLYRFAMRFPQHILVLNSYNKEVVLKERIATSGQVILLSGGKGINLVHFNN